MWKTAIYSNGVQVDAGLRSAIEAQVRRALNGLGTRIGHVHVRLYGDVDGSGLHTCYVRVDSLPSGGVARGATAPDLQGALARVLSRIGSAMARSA
jgi:hypothetical protein